jgi:hypothetical protein
LVGGGGTPGVPDESMGGKKGGDERTKDTTKKKNLRLKITFDIKTYDTASPFLFSDTVLLLAVYYCSFTLLHPKCFTKPIP